MILAPLSYVCVSLTAAGRPFSTASTMCAAAWASAWVSLKIVDVCARYQARASAVPGCGANMPVSDGHASTRPGNWSMIEIESASPEIVITMDDVSQAPKYSRAYQRLALSILSCAYMLSYIDRQIVNILAESIRRDLKLADWQLGIVTGLAFALFYTMFGIPIARLAERRNRPRLVATSMLVWSLFTILCGRAESFIGLAAARLGVGVGEAGCAPTAHSLISDYVPKERRASALAAFSLALPIGSFIGLAMGGIIADAYGWRIAFG